MAGKGSIEAGQTIFHIVNKYSFKKDVSEKRLMQLMHFFWALGELTMDQGHCLLFCHKISLSGVAQCYSSTLFSFLSKSSI